MSMSHLHTLHDQNAKDWTKADIIYTDYIYQLKSVPKYEAENKL